MSWCQILQVPAPPKMLNAAFTVASREKNDFVLMLTVYFIFWILNFPIQHIYDEVQLECQCCFFLSDWAQIVDDGVVAGAEADVCVHRVEISRAAPVPHVQPVLHVLTENYFVNSNTVQRKLMATCIRNYSLKRETEKVPNTANSWLKAATTTFIFKTLYLTGVCWCNVKSSALNQEKALVVWAFFMSTSTT